MNHKNRILVVEDESLIALHLAETLSSLGYDVPEPVATGEDAIDSAKNNHPDLILMDIQLLGEMNGIEAAEKIQAVSDIPVVYLTAGIDDSRMKQVRLTGPYGCLIKPFNARELNATIETALYRHSLDRKLRASEERLRSVMDNSPDVIYRQNLETRKYEYYSAACTTMYGFSPEEMIAMDETEARERVHPDDRADLDASLARLNETGQVRLVVRWKIRSGEYRWLSASMTIIRDENGRPLYRDGVVRDITERKRAEEELHESHRMLQDIVNTVPVRVFWKDKNLSYLGCNVAFARDAGCDSPAEIIGKDDYQMGWQEEAELYRADDNRVIESGRARLLIEEPQTTPSGERIFLLTSKVPLRDATDEIVGVLGMYLDVTGRKLSEEALRQANKKLNLLSSISRHDVNNHMTNLMAYLELMQEKLTDPTLKRFLDNSVEIAQRISAIIRFTKEYQEIGVNEPAWYDCRALVDEAANEVRTGSVCVKNDLPAGSEIFADPLVVKVFYNLMDNAVRYGGKITTIRFSEKRTSGCTLVCEDDGNGIPAEEKERIFERGFGKNTGLGLFLSREILDITGITICETGVPGKGARFEITVPAGSCRVRTGAGKNLEC